MAGCRDRADAGGSAGMSPTRISSPNPRLRSVSRPAHPASSSTDGRRWSPGRTRPPSRACPSRTVSSPTRRRHWPASLRAARDSDLASPSRPRRRVGSSRSRRSTGPRASDWAWILHVSRSWPGHPMTRPVRRAQECLRGSSFGVRTTVRRSRAFRPRTRWTRSMVALAQEGSAPESGGRLPRSRAD